MSWLVTSQSFIFPAFAPRLWFEDSGRMSQAVLTTAGVTMNIDQKVARGKAEFEQTVGHRIVQRTAGKIHNLEAEAVTNRDSALRPASPPCTSRPSTFARS
jgi:hypothetical protein